MSQSSLADTNNLTSKILIFEEIEIVVQALKRFCSENNLTGLRATQGGSTSALETSADIGGVFIGDGVSVNGQTGLAAIEHIKKLRPELPIFYRLSEIDENAENETEILKQVAGGFRLSGLDRLNPIIQDKLYSAYYPIPMVTGIQNLSIEAFTANIKDCSITCGTPFMIKDEFIHGEIFSLIPLESDWCRGFMMLQTTQEEVLALIASNKTALAPDSTNFRSVNELFNEITNLIWGSMRSKYFISDQPSQVQHQQTQVPIVVDHLNKNICFGSSNPQLCFEYQIKDTFPSKFSFNVIQKLVFNLSWNPELFSDSTEKLDELIQSGELELF